MKSRRTVGLLISATQTIFPGLLVIEFWQAIKQFQNAFVIV
jgi:hypothetical protein